MTVIDVTEADFEREVVERSHAGPRRRRLLGRVVRALPPADAGARARAATRARAASCSPRSTPTPTRRSHAAFGIQGIPAVKAFRDGSIVDEFVGVQPPAAVERFFDGLVPTEADALVAAGDEASLRRGARARAGAAPTPRSRSPRLLHAPRRRRTRRSSWSARSPALPGRGLAARIRLEQAGEPDLAEAFAAVRRRGPRARGRAPDRRRSRRPATRATTSAA